MFEYAQKESSQKSHCHSFMKTIEEKQKPSNIQFVLPTSRRIIQRRNFTPAKIIEMALEIGLDLDENCALVRMLCRMDSSFTDGLSGTMHVFGSAAKKIGKSGGGIVSWGTGLIGKTAGILPGILVGGVMKMAIAPKNKVMHYLELAKRFDAGHWDEEQLKLLPVLERNPGFGIEDSWNLIMNGEKPLKQLTDIMERLNGNQRASLVNCMRRLFPICGEQGTIKAVEAAMLFVNGNYLFSLMSDEFSAVFSARLTAITEFILQVYERLSETEREKYWLVSTGSDPHIDNRHVLFLINKKNDKDKKVYKPRSTKIDNEMVGSTGMIAYINRTLDPDVPGLPTMQIESRNPGTPEEAGVEEFVEKKTRFTKEEAKIYFYQMGMLDVISKYLGLADLHQDNIMPTIGGPLPIDAEVGLFRRENELSGALRASETPTGAAPNALFWIHETERNISSIEAYMENQRNNEYAHRYEAGRIRMQRHMAQLLQRKNFVLQLRKKTSGLRVRIVPKPTSIFAQIHRDIVGTAMGIEEFINEFKGRTGENFDLDILKGEICEYLSFPQEADTHPYYIENQDAVLFRGDREILTYYYNSLHLNNVPCFEVKMPEYKKEDQRIETKILLDGHEIATAFVRFRYQEVLEQRTGFWSWASGFFS